MPERNAHGIKDAWGHPRLPRKAAAQISRPRTRTGRGRYARNQSVHNSVCRLVGRNERIPSRGDRVSGRSGAATERPDWKTRALPETAAALAENGSTIQGAPYVAGNAEELRDQLMHVDGVLVWINPIVVVAIGRT